MVCVVVEVLLLSFVWRFIGNEFELGILITLGCFVLLAVVLGAQGFALERDQKTLRFLVRLPFPRSSLWSAKFITGLVMLLAGAALVSLPALICTPPTSQTSLFKSLVPDWVWGTTYFLALPYALAFFLSTAPLGSVHAAALGWISWFVVGFVTVTTMKISGAKPSLLLVWWVVLVAGLLWGVHKLAKRVGFH